MRTMLKRALWGTLIAGGITLLGATVANAAETTTGDDGLLSGNQIVATVQAPLTVVGNAVSVIGDSTVGAMDASTPAAPVGPAPSDVAVTSGADSIGGGNQAVVDVAAPITVTGNAVSVIGDSSTAAAAPAAPAAPAATGPTDVAATSGADSILGGNQLLLGLVTPITVGGNAVSVIGDSTVTPGTPGTPVTPGTPGTSGTPGTPGAPGTPGTTPTVVPVSAPMAAAAATRVTQLAATGGTSGLAAWLMGLVLIAGGFGALLVRRRSA